jgi:arabinose-5-phosphate isomerase
LILETDVKNRILHWARQTIRREAETLLAAAEALNESSDFCACVQAVADTPGRLVVTGIGKSAIVAQKIVATLNSTGTPALFLHAADAIHGDLGMIQSGDVVMCLSKSGETPEIRVLVPLLKNFGNLLIAMTANRESFLGKQANYVLWTPVDQEADPNNLAPTSSTAAQMAMGDALAVALLSLRGFTQEDFAKFHPGGALGKQLYLRVRDLCVQHERPVVSSDAGLPEIILEISSKRLGATAVLAADGALQGVITDGDLRRMLAGGVLREGLRARDIMSAAPKQIHPDALAVEALATMRRYAISQLLVLDGAEYIGVVHLHDLIREGIV